ncbi:hypothetical protein WS7_06265 [Xanthomonas citri pv. malvacearum str. GSPB2388]|nr:hypothetical protein WS7_06265 [Xanthomonas citri pv. malvacearum str. GSPB2388]
MQATPSKLERSTMPAETQLEIASCLLGHLIQHHPTRNLPERLDDIRHWLDMAAEQMRTQGDDGCSSGQTPASAAPRPTPSVRRAVIDRTLLPPNPHDVGQWRAYRARKDDDHQPKPGRRKPSIH